MIIRDDFEWTEKKNPRLPRSKPRTSLPTIILLPPSETLVVVLFLSYLIFVKTKK